MVVILAELQFSLEKQQFTTSDEVSHLQERLNYVLGILDDGPDIAEDLLALDKVFESEVAVKKMEVGLQ